MKGKRITAIIALVLSLCLFGCMFAGCGVEPATVTLEKEAVEVFVDETVKLKATTDRELLEDEELTWTSDKEAVATVTKNGTVKGVSDGTAVITVSIGDSSASCTVTVKTKRTMTISAETATIDLDSATKTLQLTATCSDGGEVTWKSSDETVATVDASGLVTAVDAEEKTRTVTITASREEASASCTITVVKPSAPESYELVRGTSNAKIVENPGAGVWCYFDKTSNGSQISISEKTYKYDVENGARLSVTFDYISATNTDGGDTEMYLRYLPTYAEGAAYTFSCKLTCNIVGYVVINEQQFAVENAGDTIEISIGGTVSTSAPMNIRCYFFGGDAENPLETPIVLSLTDIEFTEAVAE